MKVLNIDQFKEYINNLEVSRKITIIQNHHTYKPSYEDFTGNNYVDIHESMRYWHKVHKHWDDIAQHITTFPDGKLIIGRDFEKDPVGIAWHNHGALCLEHVGNFDLGNDNMTNEHSVCILKVNKILSDKFIIPINISRFYFHHWFDRDTGERTGGESGNVKTCPGTNFYYGNSESDGKDFLNLVAGIQV